MSQPTDTPSPADPQARFPESELVQAINRLRSVYLPGATPRHLSASECRSIRQHIREAIEAHDALRERCLAAEMRVAPLSLALSVAENRIAELEQQHVRCYSAPGATTGDGQ